jgi:hypothetical protein
MCPEVMIVMEQRIYTYLRGRLTQLFVLDVYLSIGMSRLCGVFNVAHDMWSIDWLDWLEIVYCKHAEVSQGVSVDIRPTPTTARGPECSEQ